MDARRHEVLPSALRSALEKNRRLDLDETLRVEIVAHRLGRADAALEVPAHLGPAQIEIAIRQAEILVDLVAGGIVEGKRRCVGKIVQFKGGCIDSISPVARFGFAVRRAAA